LRTGSLDKEGAMRVSVWNNGGNVYGIDIGDPNRDRYFDRSWVEIEVEMDDEVNRFELSESFWEDCSEIRSPVIREWLRRYGLLTWPKGDRPKMELVPLEGNRFRLVPP
jgi:hypothetical protein